MKNYLILSLLGGGGILLESINVQLDQLPLAGVQWLQVFVELLAHRTIQGHNAKDGRLAHGTLVAVKGLGRRASV